MFGRQAVRLLREAWGGILHPDAQGMLRERGAKQLADELYSMFDPDIPLEHDAPITINKGSNGIPLTINNTAGSPSLVVQGGVNTSGDFTVGGGDVVLGGDKVTIGGGGTGGGFGDGSTVNLKGATLDLKFGDITLTDPATGQSQTLQDYIAAHAGGAGALMGIVTGGSGQTYSVDVYGNGYASPSTASLSGVKAPDVGVGEALDAGTHVPVFRAGSTYYIFPPVWL